MPIATHLLRGACAVLLGAATPAFAVQTLDLTASYAAIKPDVVKDSDEQFDHCLDLGILVLGGETRDPTESSWSFLYGFEVAPFFHYYNQDSTSVWYYGMDFRLLYGLGFSPNRTISFQLLPFIGFGPAAFKLDPYTNGDSKTSNDIAFDYGVHFRSHWWLESGGAAVFDLSWVGRNSSYEYYDMPLDVRERYVTIGGGYAWRF